MPNGSPSTDRPPVVLTRAPEDNAALAALLRARGLTIVEWPATATRPVEPPGGRDAVLDALERADVVAFTSRRGVRAAEALAPEIRASLGRCLLAAVGPATARALEARGLAVSFLARGSGSNELASLLIARAPPAARMVLLRSAAADDALPRALERAGFTVHDVRIYEPVPPQRPAAAEGPLAAVVCASPSAARQVLAWHPWAASAAFVAVGRTTARALGALGVAHVTVARRPDADALADAVLLAVGRASAGPPAVGRAGARLAP